MSSEQSLDPQLIEQTKQQIRSLVSEIARLSRESLSPEEFYTEFLGRVVSALAAIGGAVWTVNDEGRLGLQYQINLQKTRLREDEEGQARHNRLLYKTLAGGEGILVPPHSGTGDESDDQAANPTDFLLVMGPLKTDLETVGVLEVFQRPGSGPSTQQGYLRFLLQMCELAADYLKSHQLRHFSDRQVLWTQLEDFTHTTHTSLDPRETAYTIANEGRRLIECDRLSVAISKGHKCHIEAISGQDLFDKRSNVVRLLGRLATAVVATGEPIWYTGDTRDMAPQVEDAVQEYIDEAHSKTVAVLPLKRPELSDDEDPGEYHVPEPPFGALIVEQIEDSRVPESMKQRVNVVCRHSATALGNSLEHQNLFLMPLWRAIGKARWVFHARTLPKTISITAAILLLIIILIVWPANFKMYSKGTLEPVDRRDVFAEIDGLVDQIYVKHGDMVAEGQILARLQNTDLDVAVRDILGQRNETRERISVIRRDLNARGLNVHEENRLRGELAGLLEKQRSLDSQWILYEKKQQDLEVRSPIDGQIATWDLHRRLINRPVQRGQVLLHVADPDGPWQLELQMPEDQMGYIVQTQNARDAELRKRLDEVMAQRSDPSGAEIAEASDDVPGSELTLKLRELLGDELQADLREQLEKITRRIAGKPEPPPAEEAAEPTDDDAAAETSEPTPSDADSESAAETVSEPAAEATVEAPQNPLVPALEHVAAADSYIEMRTRLENLLTTMPDSNLRNKLVALLDDGLSNRLKVVFQLATDPGTSYEGAVKEIALGADVHGDEGNTVLIKVAIDKQELPSLRPGASVNGKVFCGKRSLGFTMFHDAIGFVRSRILFRYF